MTSALQMCFVSSPHPCSNMLWLQVKHWRGNLHWQGQYLCSGIRMETHTCMCVQASAGGDMMRAYSCFVDTSRQVGVMLNSAYWVPRVVASPHMIPTNAHVSVHPITLDVIRVSLTVPANCQLLVHPLHPETHQLQSDSRYPTWWLWSFSVGKTFTSR